MDDTTNIFPTLNLEELSDSDTATQQRRLMTYSVEALRAGAAIDTLYVQHPQFQRAIQVMDRLFQLGQELDMPQGAYVEGPPGVGKSSLFKYFKRTLPKSGLFSQSQGVIGLRVPNKPRTGHFVSALLRAINYPFSTGSTVQLYQRRPILLEGLKLSKTRLLFLDEAQNLMHQRKPSPDQDWESESTDFLRLLMDEARLSLYMVGSSGMKELETISPALSSRISVREKLTYFNRDATWAGLVKALSKDCKVFNLSFLCEPQVLARLHLASRGDLRQFKRIVTEAIMLAVDSRALELNGALLVRAYSVAFGSGRSESNPFE